MLCSYTVLFYVDLSCSPRVLQAQWYRWLLKADSRARWPQPQRCSYLRCFAPFTQEETGGDVIVDGRAVESAVGEGVILWTLRCVSTAGIKRSFWWHAGNANLTSRREVLGRRLAGRRGCLGCADVDLEGLAGGCGSGHLLFLRTVQCRVSCFVRLCVGG